MPLPSASGAEVAPQQSEARQAVTYNPILVAPHLMKHNKQPTKGQTSRTQAQPGYFMGFAVYGIRAMAKPRHCKQIQTKPLPGQGLGRGQRKKSMKYAG